jgi:hypothetical protein
MYLGQYPSCKKLVLAEFMGVVMKPWLWWAYPYVDLAWRWLSARQRLPHYSRDLIASLTSLSTMLKLGFPLIVFVFWVAKGWKYWNTPTTTLTPFHSSRKFFKPLSWIAMKLPNDGFSFALFVGASSFGSLLLSVKMATPIVPLNLDPYTSWIMFVEWMTLFSAVCCGFISYGYYIQANNTSQFQLGDELAAPREKLPPFQFPVWLCIGHIMLLWTWMLVGWVAVARQSQKERILPDFTTKVVMLGGFLVGFFFLYMISFSRIVHACAQSQIGWNSKNRRF